MKKGNIRKNVEKLLEMYPKTRNCDKLLCVYYWRDFDGLPVDDNKTSKDFANLFVTQSTGFESISRARRVIQEEGLFLATNKKVQKARKQKQKSMVEAITQKRGVV